MGLGILEARLCPIDEKYLFMIFGNSEKLSEIRSFPGHLSEVIFLRTVCGLGILEARLCPNDEKYLSMIFGNSEKLSEIRSFPGHLSEVIF